LTTTASQDQNQYRAVFSNSQGSAISSAATLTVQFAPTITMSPTGQTVAAGNKVTFTAAGSGDPSPTVQWQVSTNGGGTFTNISGATATTYSFTTTASQDQNQYRAVFSNSQGSAISSAATLTVEYAPTITKNPISQTVTAGNSVSFTVIASGNPAPNVQWQVSTNGGSTFNNISGATSTTLTLSSITIGLSGNQYRALFTNSAGSATTNAASLTVDFVDNFNRADSTNLGSNWTTVLGHFGISSNQAAGQSGSVDLAQVNGMSLTDTAVSGAVNVGTTGERYASVFARRDAAGNMYVAILGVNRTGNPAGSPTAALLYRFTPGLAGTISGGWSLLAYTVLPTPPNTGSADLRLEVTGSGLQTTLRLYLNGVLTLTFTESQTALSGVSNNPLNGPGGVGMLSIDAGTTYGNFFAGAITPPSAAFADAFNRSNSFYLGNPWSVQIGGFELSGNQAVPLSSVSLAALYGYSQGDVAEQANADLSGVAAGGQLYASLFARRDALGDMYVGMLGINLAADPRAAVLVWLYQPGNPVNNGWTLLNFSYVSGGATSGTLTFDVIGTALTVTFGTTTVSTSSSALAGPGSIGILNVFTPTSFSNFSVVSPPPQALDGTPLTGTGVVPLTANELAPVVTAAEQRWQAAGLSTAQLAKFEGLQFVVTTLSSGMLGEYVPGTIYLDATADGYGWFMDPTASPVTTQVDLLTVVMHEMGHALGLPDITTPGSTDLMAQALAKGIRRLPSVADIDAAFAASY
jgi:hypothetical protein